jgi:mRNA interferase RelE/StbE
VQQDLVASAENLAADPRRPGARKLTGHHNRWRIRVGSYRIIYEIRDEILIVLVVAVGHRREVYRRIE